MGHYVSVNTLCKGNLPDQAKWRGPSPFYQVLLYVGLLEWVAPQLHPLNLCPAEVASDISSLLVILTRAGAGAFLLQSLLCPEVFHLL